MFDPHTYTIVVKKVQADDETLFRAAVQELPDIETYAQTYGEAYELAIDAIEGLNAAAEEEGRPFPAPQESEGDYSGRVTLRMPKGLHQRIATTASIEGVSLNHYVVSVLAYAANSGSAYFIGTTASVSTPQPRAIRENWNVYWENIRAIDQYESDTVDFAEQAKSPWKLGRGVKHVTVRESESYPASSTRFRALIG